MRLFFLMALILASVGCGNQKRGKAAPQNKSNLNKTQVPPDMTLVDQPGSQKAPPLKREEKRDEKREAPPGVLVPPAKNDIPSTQSNLATKPAASKRLDRTTVELTFEETLNLYQLAGSALGQNLPLLFSPQLPLGLKTTDFAFQLQGNYDKAELTIEVGSEPLIVIPDIKMELGKPSQNEVKIAGKDFMQFGICIGPECEVLSLATYQAKEKKLLLNYPTLFKKVDGKYKPARRINDKEFEAQYKQLEKDALDPEKMPPQLKVRALFEKNVKELESKILESIRQITKNDKVIYSARLFANILAGSCDPEFKVEETKVNFENTCDFLTFTHGGKRNAENFKGQVAGDESLFKSSAGMQVKVKAIKSATDLVKGFGFYEVEYRQPKHQTPMSESPIEAQQNRLCQVLVVKNQTYTHCEFVASERVFDGLALEGFYEGPLYIKDDVKGQPVILKTRQGLEKARRPEDIKPLKPEEVTDGQ
jgi:hypothetical protein